MKHNILKSAFLATSMVLLSGPFSTVSGSTAGDFILEVVGPFDQFDTSSIGALLIKEDMLGGFTGYYQSTVVDFSKGFTSVASPSLDAGDYELTVTAMFSGTTQIGGFTITDGTANMYWDNTPNSDLATDSGFDDGTLIATGDISSGGGVFTVFAPGTGIGASTLFIDLDTSLNAFQDTFTPTFPALEASFTQQTNAFYVAGINSVMGATFESGDLMLQADGNLKVVPIPAAAWLFGSALVGFVAFSRRRKI